VKRALVVAVLATVIAGCGSSGTKTVTVTTPSTIAASTPATTSNQTATLAYTVPVVPTVHLSAFRSPTGNIGCIIISGGARCDISKRHWSPPPRPASCPPVVDFGQGLAVNPSGPGRFVCAGDTAMNPQAAPLAYGTHSTVGTVTCVSATEGITCTDTDTHHGFFIAVQSYRTF
jgi:hypothetical protein